MAKQDKSADKKTTAKRKRVHGDGSVYYDAREKKWIGAYRVGYKPNGKPDMRHVRAATESECHKKLNDLIKESHKTEYVYIQKDTVETYLKLWLTTVKRLQLKEKSYDRLEQTIDINVCPYIGRLQVGALRSDDVQRMIADLQSNGRSYSTIKKAYDAVNAACKWGLACMPPKLKANPCLAVVLPSRKLFKPSEIKFYTREEAKLISETALTKYKCGTPWYPLGGLVVLSLNTGIRIGELASLEWERDIDMNNRILYVHRNIVTVKDRSPKATKKYKTIEQDTVKTEAGQDRGIPLNDDAIKALESLKEHTGKYKYVLATKEGNRKSVRDIDKIVRRIEKRAGLPDEKIYGHHALRHTFATLLLENVTDIKIVSELLGHSNVSITYNTYIHIIKEQKAKALETLPNFI